jgi:DNA-binding beta-propeller fold protein YncE
MRWFRRQRPIRKAASVVVGSMLVAAVMILWSGSASRRNLSASAVPAALRAKGQPQLVSIQPLPELSGEMCELEPASATETLMAALQQPRASSSKSDAGLTLSPDQVADLSRRRPVRMVKDNYSAYSQVAVDLTHDEVVMTDESLFQILVYNRTENTPPKASMSEPKRILGGMETSIEYQCGVYVDQASGDIYAVNNDTVDKLVIFGRDKKGNVPPTRIINTPHTTYGIAVDEKRQELFLTAQESSAISVYKKTAAGDESPVRLLQGDKTLLADPHGIAIDSDRNLLFVSNFGNVSTKSKDASSGEGFGVSNKENWPMARESAVPGTGRSTGASITVYPVDAAGDVAPLRIIKGPKTQMSWPTAMSLDAKRGDLYIANDTGDSVLVFDVNAQGDVAPKRVIKGSKSLVKSPTGVFYDEKHNELWVTNFGNHTATVYPADANGDVAPLRVIRSAPPEAGVPNMGNAYAPAYDSKRDQILVPN